MSGNGERALRDDAMNPNGRRVLRDVGAGLAPAPSTRVYAADVPSRGGGVEPRPYADPELDNAHRLETRVSNLIDSSFE